MDKMKILLVSPVYEPSSYGGVKAHVTSLSRALADKGHQVTVYTSNAYDRRSNLPVKGEVRLHGVRVVYFENRFPRQHWFTPSMCRIINREMPTFDIVHLHHNYTFQNLVAYRSARRFHTPFVFSPHGTLVPHGRSRLKKALYNALCGNGIRKDAGRIIAISPLEVQQCVESGMGIEKLELIPQAVDCSPYEHLPSGEIFRSAHGIGHSELVILFLGRLHEIKGLDILLHAFRRLIETSPDAKLVIAGPDFGYLGRVKQLVRELSLDSKVMIPGGLFGASKLEALAAADIFVLSSRYETYSVAALEASASGIPVVATDRCGNAAFVKDHGGIVVPYSQEDLAAALKRLAENPDLRAALGTEGRIRVKELHSWPVVINRIEAIYTAVLRERAGAGVRSGHE